MSSTRKASLGFAAGGQRPRVVEGGRVGASTSTSTSTLRGRRRVGLRLPLGCDCLVRRGGWPCREGEDSLSDAQDRLECIRLDLMNLKQHMAVVAELLPCLEKNPVRFVWPRNVLSANVSPHARYCVQTDKRLQDAVTHSASKAKMLHNKCTNHLAHPPSFVRLVSRAVGGGSGGGGSAGHSAGHSSSGSAQLVWPPPDADASTQAAMLEKKWCAVQCECASWKPTVLRVFNETMRLVRARGGLPVPVRYSAATHAPCWRFCSAGTPGNSCTVHIATRLVAHMAQARTRACLGRRLRSPRVLTAVLRLSQKWTRSHLSSSMRCVLGLARAPLRHA